MTSKKWHPRFAVPNLGSPNRKGIKDRWRKQRGKNNKTRIEQKMHNAIPKVGYKNSADSRFALSDGTREMLVHNERELMRLKGVQGYVAVLSHQLSERKKDMLASIASKNGIKIANR